MNRNTQLAERIQQDVFFNSQPRLRACQRSERVAELPVLDQTDIENLMAALDDTRNAAAAALLAYSGAQSVSGIVARLVVASDAEQFVLQTLIRTALDEHERITAAAYRQV
jgi:hypothetical protein